MIAYVTGYRCPQCDATATLISDREGGHHLAHPCPSADGDLAPMELAREGAVPKSREPPAPPGPITLFFPPRAGISKPGQPFHLK